VHFIFISHPGCIFGDIFNFLNVFIDFDIFNVFYLVLMVSIGLNGYLSREPIRLELDEFSDQMVDSRSESWHFWKLAYGLLGWGTTLRELKVPSEIVPLKNIYYFKPPNGSVVFISHVGSHSHLYLIWILHCELFCPMLVLRKLPPL